MDARQSAGGLMLPWSSVVFVVRLTPSYLLQYIAVAAVAAAVAVAAACLPHTTAVLELTGASRDLHKDAWSS